MMKYHRLESEHKTSTVESLFLFLFLLFIEIFVFGWILCLCGTLRIPDMRFYFYRFRVALLFIFFISVYFVLFDHSKSGWFYLHFFYLKRFWYLCERLNKIRPSGSFARSLFTVSIFLRILISRADFYVNLSPLLDIIINRIEAIMICKICCMHFTNDKKRHFFFCQPFLVLFFVQTNTSKKSISRYFALFPILCRRQFSSTSSGYGKIACNISHYKILKMIQLFSWI